MHTAKVSVQQAEQNPSRFPPAARCPQHGGTRGHAVPLPWGRRYLLCAQTLAASWGETNLRELKQLRKAGLSSGIGVFLPFLAREGISEKHFPSYFNTFFTPIEPSESSFQGLQWALEPVQEQNNPRDLGGFRGASRSVLAWLARGWWRSPEEFMQEPHKPTATRLPAGCGTSPAAPGLLPVIIRGMDGC